MSHSDDALQDYLDSLFSDAPLNEASRISDVRVDESALKLASGSNIAPLSSVSRPVRAAPARPYAEPIRTLNLRMPLPPVAPAVEAVPAVDTQIAIDTKIAVETKTVVETKTAVEAKAAVEIEPRVEIKPTLEIKPTVEAPTIIETTARVESKPSDVAPQPEQRQQSHTNNDLAAMAPPAPWLPNGRPQWAQQPFECLIFKAGGLQLAAPLVELGSIYPLEKDALTEIFGQTQWFMGLLPIKEYNVRAMDTGLVVMPERYNAAMREEYRYIVSLFGSDWGLAVDSVVGTTLLDPERVRWRGERTKRPWLAGTMIDQMCALFDIAQLAWLFHSSDRKRASR